MDNTNIKFRKGANIKFKLSKISPKMSGIVITDKGRRELLWVKPENCMHAVCIHKNLVYEIKWHI